MDRLDRLDRYGEPCYGASVPAAALAEPRFIPGAFFDNDAPNAKSDVAGSGKFRERSAF